MSEAAFADSLLRFERHLAAERGASLHTLRAYLADVRAFAAHFIGRIAADLGQDHFL